MYNVCLLNVTEIRLNNKPVIIFISYSIMATKIFHLVSGPLYVYTQCSLSTKQG